MTIAPTEAPTPLLTHADRCDSCQARAYVLVVLHWSPAMRNNPELYFCNHHFRAHEQALAPFTSMTVDERWQLTEGIKDDHWVEGKAAK